MSVVGVFQALLIYKNSMWRLTAHGKIFSNQNFPNNFQ